MDIVKALSEVQSKLKAPKNQFNSFGKYNYRNCEDILESLKPILAPIGAMVTLTDSIVAVGNRVYVKATASFWYGEKDISVDAWAREADEKKGMDVAQVTGAASSYARKYALNGLFLIDDTKDPDHGQKEEPVTAKVPVQTIDPAFVAKREAEKAKMKADMETLGNAVSKAPSKAVDESLGEEWASLPPGPAPIPVGQKEHIGVIKAYYPAEGKKPHKILVDRDYFTSYNKGIAELMSSLTNKQVVITYHSDPWEYNGKSGVNHIVDKIEAK